MNNFHKLWLYVLFYKVGDWIRIIAIPLAIYDKTGSGLYMATAYGISFIPWILSIFGGVVSDKFSKRRILKISSLTSSAMMGLIIFTLHSSEFNLYLLMLLLFLLSLIEPFSHPAEQSFIPLLVEKEELVSANSAIQLINNTLSTLGPIVGGLIIALLGTPSSLMISSLLFCISFIPVAKIGVSGMPTSTGSSHLLSDIKAGIRVAFNTKFVLYGALLFFFTNLAINLFQANLIFFIVDILGYSTIEVSIILSIAGIGSICGSLFAKYLNKKYPPHLIISTSTLLAGIATYLMIYAQHYLLIGAMLGITYFLGSINVVTYFSTRQKLIAQAFLGRVVSVTRLISFLSIPFGAFMGGILLNHLGYTIAFILFLSGTIRTLAGILSFFLLKVSATPNNKIG